MDKTNLHILTTWFAINSIISLEIERSWNLGSTPNAVVRRCVCGKDT